MPMAVRKGNAAASAANVKAVVDDVFSPYLYDGNGSSSVALVNGIDLSTKGGLVWTKGRSQATSHLLIDTVRGATKYLSTNNTNAENTSAVVISGFNTNGYNYGNDGWLNGAGQTYVSWTFRESAKFFDVVTWTGDGVDYGNNGRPLNHSLGVTPGFILIKCTSHGSTNWTVWHKDVLNMLYMNSSNTGDNAQGNYGVNVGFVPPSANTFNLGRFAHGTYAPGIGGEAATNLNGRTYVAYLFAHDTTADGIVQCGTFTTDGSGKATVTLGWEPQWTMTKATSQSDNWMVGDVFRGLDQVKISRSFPNTTDVEDSVTSYVTVPTATGFAAKGFSSSTTYCYVAIRRPQKVPTSPTSVYTSHASSAAQDTVLSTGFPIDLQIATARTGTTGHRFFDRLRGMKAPGVTGAVPVLFSHNTNAEESASYAISNKWNNTGFAVPSTYNSVSAVYHSFRRAKGFFDEVCFTGTGAANQRVPHNLGVVPELLIVKDRAGAGTTWSVYHKDFPSSQLAMNSTSGANSGTSGAHHIWGTAPATHSATDFGIDTWWTGSATTNNHVAYMFATLAGISKVGSYTGNGTSQTINCGFAAGARFVMIKRTDAGGNWCIFDTVRGIVAGNDPIMAINTSGAEESLVDNIDPDASGFIINQQGSWNLNVNGATYIYLAIA